MGKAYLITGEPRVGKTTILVNILERLIHSRISGFYTQEIRVDGERVGFEMITLDGKRETISHIDFDTPIRVSRYGVSVEKIEKIGIPPIHKGIKDGHIILIDEIGPMELLSEKLKTAIMEALDSQSIVIGTIVQRSHPWVDNLKKDHRIKLIHLEPNNRESVAEQLEQLVKNCNRQS